MSYAEVLHSARARHPLPLVSPVGAVTRAVAQWEWDTSVKLLGSRGRCEPWPDGDVQHLHSNKSTFCHNFCKYPVSIFNSRYMFFKKIHI